MVKYIHCHLYQALVRSLTIMIYYSSVILQVFITGILGYVGARDDSKPNKCLVSFKLCMSFSPQPGFKGFSHFYLSISEQVLEEFLNFLQVYFLKKTENLSMATKQAVYVNGSPLNPKQYCWISKTGSIRYEQNDTHKICFFTGLEIFKKSQVEFLGPVKLSCSQILKSQLQCIS